ncbi:hypothetical protein PAMP_022854 [Pampus punctatissimus]
MKYVEKPMIKLYMERAKDSYIARELALLRASHPQPPVVSHMDEVNGSTIEEAVHRMIAAGASERTATLSNATATFPPALSLSTSIHATDSVGPGSTDCEPSTPVPQTLPPSALSSPSDTEVHSAVFSATDSVSLVPTDCGLSMSPLRGSPTAVTALSPLLPSTTASSSLANKPPCSVVRRNHHLLPRRPAHGCENCQFLLAELRVTRQLLECEIERNDELKQLHSSTMRTNPSCVRLGERGIKALTVELRARVRDIGRDVVGHQLLVRHKLVKAITHAQFIEEAPKHIDAALGTVSCLCVLSANLAVFQFVWWVMVVENQLQT